MTRVIIACVGCCLVAVLLWADTDSTPTSRVQPTVSALRAVPRRSEELHRPIQFMTDGAQGQGSEQPSHECTFAESVNALGTSCCEMPAAASQAVEEYVCGGSPESHLFIDRICTFPGDQNNPCGQVGANGCAVCWTAPYTKDCLASVNSRNPNLCVYAFK
jgi:hypothetical protein